MAAERAAFEKRIASGSNSWPCRAGKSQVAVAAAVVDQPEERQQLRPRAVARVHRVRIARLVLPQPLEQPGHRVVLLVDIARRHQPAVLGVEDEHQPHQRGEQPAVHLVRLFAQHLREQLALRIVVRALESADQFPQRLEHLAGQLGGDVVLILAALGAGARATVRLVLDDR